MPYVLHGLPAPARKSAARRRNTLCQRIAGIQLPDWATVPDAGSHQPVRHGLIHRLLNIGQKTCNTRIGLRHFGCTGVQQVIQVGLNVVLQPVEPVALIKEITAGHDALLQDCRIVLVIHKHVAFFGIQRRRLSSRESFVSDPRLLFKFQGNGGIAAVEIHRKRAAKCRQRSVLAAGGILYERAPVFCRLQLVGQIPG